MKPKANIDPAFSEADFGRERGKDGERHRGRKKRRKQVSNRRREGREKEKEKKGIKEEAA